MQDFFESRSRLTDDADVVVVGSGISGMLVARECLRANLRVIVIERGALRSHADQLADNRYESDLESARHNHETSPGTPGYPWDYLYAVGGSSLHWSGHSPRLQPDDFRMESAYGVMQDWPIDLDELAPYYERAENALAVAGGAGGQPAHPLSPMDRLVAPLLEPFAPLPQARPSLAVGNRPACCGAATCALCPVDSRFSVLNGVQDVLEHPSLDLRTGVVASQVELDRSRKRAVAVRTVDNENRTGVVSARRVVLAASGFENPAILLRSGLDRPATGRFLFDHRHRTLWIRLKCDVGAGKGHSISTGYTTAFAEGSFRSQHSGAIATPYNPGVPLGSTVAGELLKGHSGEPMREAAVDRWRRTLPFDVLLEDVPRAERAIALSPRRDRFGLPLIRVTYPGPSRYELDGFEFVRQQLVERLAPLGVEAVEEAPAPSGGHLLGTCRMGTSDAVVTPELRHLDVENLFVVGGSAFPTYSPCHPTLTIAALAIRLGDLLAEVTSSG